MPSKPSGLTPTSSPTPLRQSDLSSAHPPPSGCPPAFAAPAFLPCGSCWHYLYRIQMSYMPKTGLNRACYLFLWHLQGLLEEEIVTHSNIVAWSTPWTKEPGGLSRNSRNRGKRVSTGSVLTLWAEFAHPISVDFHVTQRTRSWPPCRANCPDFLVPPGQGQLNLLQGTLAGGGRRKGCPTPPTPLGLREPGLRLAGGGVGGVPEAGS